MDPATLQLPVLDSVAQEKLALVEKARAQLDVVRAELGITTPTPEVRRQRVARALGNLASINGEVCDWLKDLGALLDGLGEPTALEDWAEMIEAVQTMAKFFDSVGELLAVFHGLSPIVALMDSHGDEIDELIESAPKLTDEYSGMLDTLRTIEVEDFVEATKELADLAHEEFSSDEGFLSDVQSGLDDVREGRFVDWGEFGRRNGLETD